MWSDLMNKHRVFKDCVINLRHSIKGQIRTHRKFQKSVWTDNYSRPFFWTNCIFFVTVSAFDKFAKNRPTEIRWMNRNVEFNMPINAILRLSKIALFTCVIIWKDWSGNRKIIMKFAAWNHLSEMYNNKRSLVLRRSFTWHVRDVRDLANHT